MINLAKEKVSSIAQSARDKVSGLVGNAKDRGKEMLNSSGLGKLLRNPPDSEQAAAEIVPARFSTEERDWRVKLSLPFNYPKDTLLAPLIETGGLVFPYTPTIIIYYQAQYNTLQPEHTNYPFLNYQSSQIQDLVITGDFFIENAKDARYWVAAVQYLRAMTKMSYGMSPDRGAPPPVVRLNGYGDFVFPNVPVVIKNYTWDLPADCDYVKTQVDGEVEVDVTTTLGNEMVTWAPTQSQLSVTVSPVYSRSKVSQFNLNKFINGGYLGNEQTGKGFI